MSSEVPKVTALDLGLDELQSALRAQSNATERAATLEGEASAIRDSARVSVKEAWQTAGNRLKSYVARPEDDELLLRTVLAFCDIKPPISPTDQKAYNSGAVLDLYHSLSPEEPIITEDRYGLVATRPRTRVVDYFSGLGAVLELDILEIDPEGTYAREVIPVEFHLREKDMEKIHVGHPAVSDYLSIGWLERLSVGTSRHSFDSNHNLLDRALRMANAFNAGIDLGIDVSDIEARLTSEKFSSDHHGPVFDDVVGLDPAYVRRRRGIPLK